MGKKSYLSVGKFFTIAAMFISSMILFTGCESQEDVEHKFRSEIRENFTRKKASAPYLDGIFFKDVKITEEDGDDYKLDITFSCYEEEYIAKGTGFYDGDKLTWEIPGSELEKVCAGRVKSEIKIKLAGYTIDSIEVMHVKGFAYTYTVVANGKILSGQAFINKDNGRITII